MTQTRQDFLLPRGECAQALLDSIGTTRLIPDGTVFFEPRMDRIQQHLIIEGLLQKLEGPGLHRADRDRDVAMSGDHDHGQIDLPCLQAVLQIQATHSPAT